MMFFSYFESPVGTLLLAGDKGVLRGISFPNEQGPERPGTGWQRDASVFSDVADQLARYFAGSLTEFDLTLRPEGTPFQLQVYDALLTIPYGATTTYGSIAEKIGRPRAVRAVGAANGRNPIPIVIPCHRVIGADGSLTGFGGGLDVKRFLLELESGQRTLM